MRSWATRRMVRIAWVQWGWSKLHNAAPHAGCIRVKQLVKAAESVVGPGHIRYDGPGVAAPACTGAGVPPVGAQCAAPRT